MGTNLNYVKCIEKTINEYGYILDSNIRRYRYRLIDLLLNDEYKSGKYLICLANPPHAMTYIDGIVYDSNFSLDPILTSKILCMYKQKEETIMNKKVFLGGTCNGSKWRDELIPLLNIDYFNPVVEDWTEECYQRELKEREECDFCLYVITPLMTGVYSIAEVVDDSNKRPEKTVFCVLNEDKDPATQRVDFFTAAQIKSLDKVGVMVQNNGGYYATSLEEVTSIVNTPKSK